MPKAEFDVPIATPDLKLGSLNIFIIGLQYPHSDWLSAAACCSHPESYVSAQGPFMRINEIERFLQGCEAMQTKQHELAQLYCIEQSVLLDLSAGAPGVLNLKYQICPDCRHMNEAHTYWETIDRSKLPEIVLACRALLERISNFNSLIH
jgi:hypothetical protein